MDDTDQVLSEVSNERELQREKWGNEHDDGHSMGEWLDLFDERVSKARRTYEPPAERRALRRHLVVLAALAVAAVESLDREADRLVGAELESEQNHGEGGRRR